MSYGVSKASRFTLKPNSQPFAISGSRNGLGKKLCAGPEPGW